jgi:hypothetical protein
MVWLLSGLVLAVGLAVLVVMAVALIGRLRRNQSAVAALRACVGDGSERLRAGAAMVREWRETRGHTRHSGSSA